MIRQSTTLKAKEIVKIYENVSLAENLGLAITSAGTISSVFALANKVFPYEKKDKNNEFIF